MTTQEPGSPDSYEIQIFYSDEESMIEATAAGPTHEESIIGAIGGALVASTSGVFEQAETSKEYQEILKQIDSCSIFERRRKKTLMAKADDLRTDLTKKAILESLAHFEPIALSQKPAEE